MDLNPTEQEKVAFWEAAAELLKLAWTSEKSVLQLCDTEYGKQITGKVYTLMADMLAKAFIQAGDDAMGTFLVFLVAISALLKDREQNPLSTTSMYTLAKANYPRTLTPELDQQLKQTLDLWAEGYFAPTRYPFTFEETID